MQREAVTTAVEIAGVATLRFFPDDGVSVHVVFARQDAQRMECLDAATRIERKWHCFGEKQTAHGQWRRSMPPRNTSCVDVVSGWVRRSRITRAGLPSARL